MRLKAKLFFLILLFLPYLIGCSSISHGVASAILEHQPVDKRKCAIVGKSFPGIQVFLDNQEKNSATHSVKVLMVHGIGQHIPGYAARFREKLAHTLGLDVLSETIKTIELSDEELAKTDPAFQHLGTLLIYRYTNQTASKELLFYELTWSSITQPDKSLLDFDNADINNFRRAQLNHLLKNFMNSTIPDLLIYMGKKNAYVNASVSQAACWMFYGTWQDLPNSGQKNCSAEMIESHNHIADNDYFFITHSLGSRITIDAINFFTQHYGKKNKLNHSPQFVEALKQKEIDVFMFANQMPLLQMGSDETFITNQISKYCSPKGSNTSERIFSKLRIIAFNDPNDLLSYPIPHHYAESFLESRLCPEIVNVYINIAFVNSIFGAPDFADPISAHRGYQDDDRVINMIAYGVNRQSIETQLKDRCDWTEVKA
jgi:hypothetical protein